MPIHFNFDLKYLKMKRMAKAKGIALAILLKNSLNLKIDSENIGDKQKETVI